jgi:hypothetical protein
MERRHVPRIVQEVRGDARKEAIDIYDLIDKKELRESSISTNPLARLLLIDC